MPVSAPPSSTSLESITAGQKHHLLTLPTELRHQIWSHAFADLSLYPFIPILYKDCERCVEPPRAKHAAASGPASSPSQTNGTVSSSSSSISGNIFTTRFTPLLTCKQILSEAQPIFYSNLTLKISDSFSLDRIRKFSHLGLRKRIRNLDLSIHLTDDSRYAWHTALSFLVPSTFPQLHTTTIHNHMRPPTSYDRLVDAIYLAGPMVARWPRTLTVVLDFAYTKDEVMFESPFLGEITTGDSVEAHELVVRDLLRDEEFVGAARAEDFEEMTGRLLGVARGHEEAWLEGLQRRRLGGLTVREVQERVLRRRGEGEDGVVVGVGDREENGWTEEEEQEILAIEREMQGRQEGA